MTDSSPTWNSVTIVGVGLIGGSLAAAVKSRGIAQSVVGYGRNLERLNDAKNTGLIDVATVDPETAADSEWIIFCTPVDKIIPGIETLLPFCKPDTILTDAGSVKATICHQAATIIPDGVTFIGSHPLAGSEKNGFEHAEADLFAERVCVITPLPDTDRELVSRLKAFWEAVGSNVLTMLPEEHDAGLAETSHLPHIVAAALAAKLSDENRDLASTGFADTTRIASGLPELWTSIVTSNADEAIRQIDEYRDVLNQFRDALAKQDHDALQQLFQRAKANRDALD